MPVPTPTVLLIFPMKVFFTQANSQVRPVFYMHQLVHLPTFDKDFNPELINEE